MAAPDHLQDNLPDNLVDIYLFSSHTPSRLKSARHFEIDLILPLPNK